MQFEIRPISPEEFLPFARSTALAFGEQPSDKELEEEKGLFEFDRSLAAFEDKRIVGTGLIDSFQLTLPGLIKIPAAGVTWIGVLPTHRRRGILTSIMQRQLHDMRERGEAVGMLYASESIIYGRYGYGAATFQARYAIDTRHRAFRHSLGTSGSVVLADKDQARAKIPALYDQYRQNQPGELSRSEAYWDLIFLDPEHWRRDSSPRFYVLHQHENGEADGYATYRAKRSWQEGLPNNTMQLGTLTAFNPDVRAALWDFCLSVDLVQQVETGPFPLDEPLRWMLSDTRRLRTVSVNDGLWIRLVDIPEALSARRYMAEGELTIEVEDSFLPENSGAYHLETSGDDADCRRMTGACDLSLHVTDLGALYLGGHKFSSLAAAGRVKENKPGSIVRADSMFASDPAPWCSTDF